MNWQLLSHAIRQFFAQRNRRLHADTDCDRCLAPASQRRRPHPDVAGAKRREAWRHVEFLTPEGFPSVPVPTYPGLRLALPSAARDREPHRARAARRHPHRDRRDDRHHGPRAIACSAGLPFTTSYTTRFPEYISARCADSGERGATRCCADFHAAGDRHHGLHAVADGGARPSAASRNLGMWTRGVDTDLFSPDRASRSRSAAADLRQRRARRRREESRSLPLARSARHQGGDRRRARRRPSCGAASRT